MASYKTKLTDLAHQDLKSIPFPFRRQLNHRIIRLRDDPRPQGCLELSANKCVLGLHGWEIYYEVDDEKETLTVVAILKAE